MNFKMKILTGLHFSPGRSLICKNLTWRITPQHTSLQLPLPAWSPTEGRQGKEEHTQGLAQFQRTQFVGRERGTDQAWEAKTKVGVRRRMSSKG